MNIEDVRTYGLSLPQTSERCPFGPDHLALEVGGRMFCLLDLSGQWDFYNLKADPDYSLELRDSYSGIRPGFHMNKRHWISIYYHSDVSSALQRELIYHSYCQVLKNLPRKHREALGLDNATLNHND
ncbi:MAG: MmcQ/YjbR family DNA-binding protein [Muribaculaceae bacterium]|nr:MmcQ/YjbR family DNA-binding protein [Muribaculaceae bacterium]